jgi:hypothetical protein
MSDDLTPIGKRPEGLDGTELATSSYHLDTAVFDPEHPVGVPVSGPVWMETSTKRITSAAPALNELSAYQHRYYEVDFRPGQDSSDPDQPVSRHATELEKAQTWSSELVDAEGNRTGYHTVMIDIDHPVRVVPSSTEGHYHLYIEIPIKEQPYFDLLRALAVAGVIEWGYYEASRARGGTHLRLPWVQKDRLRDAIEAVGLLEATVKQEQGTRDGVNQAIPAELDRALLQSRHSEVTPADQELIDGFKGVQAEVDAHHRAKWGGDEREDDLLSLVTVPAPEARVNEAEETARLSHLENVRAKFSVQYDKDGETVEFDASEYSVVFVDGRGVLRRRKK